MAISLWGVIVNEQSILCVSLSCVVKLCKAVGYSLLQAMAEPYYLSSSLHVSCFRVIYFIILWLTAWQGDDQSVIQPRLIIVDIR